MDDAHDDTSRLLAEHERKVLENKISIAEQVANNLGPHSSTADQSYVARFTELGRRGRERRTGRQEAMEVTAENQN